MKRIILVTAIVGMLVMAGCGNPDNKRFAEVEQYGDCCLYYDKETKVMYARTVRGFTVLFSNDGTPMLYGEGTTD